MNDTMDSYNTSLYDIKSTTSNKRLSRAVQIEFEENDDTKEKKAKNKRNSAMLEMGFSRNPKSNHQNENKLDGLTSDQITHHYGDCMKLASENKITSKNAFDLHLIDYLQDYMHSLKSFQTVSSSLDAGAKIYAGRVDMVHSDTYHMLSGCGVGAGSGDGVDGSLEPNQPNEPESEDKEDTEEIKTRKPKKKTENHRKMICTNLRKIRMTAAQIRSEVDPLFQSQAQKFDEGGTGELRLNNLKILDDDYVLLLDFQSIVSTKCGDYLEDESSTALLDIGEFGNILRDLIQRPVSIAPEFEGFKFTGWDPTNDAQNIPAAESFRNVMNNEESMICDDYMDNGMDDDYVETYNEEAVVKVEGGNDVTMTAKVDEEEDNMLTLGNSKYENGSSLFVTSVKEMVNSYMENYGELNDNILGMWAGPEHWKQKAKPIKLIPTPTDRPKVPKPGKTKEVAPMFPEWVLTKLNDRKLGRLVDIKYEDAESRAPKQSTQLTDVCLNKNIKKEYILPPRTQFVFKSVNQLMNREISLVNKALKKHAEQMSIVDLGDDQLENVEKNNNANDLFEMLPSDMIVIDDDGNISNYADEAADGDAYFSDDDPYTGNSLRHCNFDDFGEQNPLSDNVKMREATDINYAKTAKRINVKKLKYEILSYLTDKIHIIDMEAVIKKTHPNVHMASEVCSLSNLLVNVDKNVSSEVSKELSVSILMTCLLHLANETGLDITNAADFSDFTLGQGYSKYDIEQIAAFGIGNDLYKDTRKRKSYESAATSKLKRISVFSDIDDDADSD